MDTKEGKTYQPQEGRILQGSAYRSDIVPVGLASSSDNGQDATTPPPRNEETSDRKELHSSLPTAVENKLNGVELNEVMNNTPVITVVESKEGNSPPEEVLQQIAEKDIETASAISGNVAMECEEFRATKRKKSHSTERQSSEESEDEILKRVKVLRRQRILGKETTSYLNKEQSRSNPDLLSRPPEEDPRIIKMKKGSLNKD